MKHELKIVTLDGLNGAGKSTIANLIAREIGLFFSSGGLYRIITRTFLELLEQDGEIDKFFRFLDVCFKQNRSKKDDELFCSLENQYIVYIAKTQTELENREFGIPDITKVENANLYAYRFGDRIYTDKSLQDNDIHRAIAWVTSHKFIRDFATEIQAEASLIAYERNLAFVLEGRDTAEVAMKIKDELKPKGVPVNIKSILMLVDELTASKRVCERKGTDDLKHEYEILVKRNESDYLREHGKSIIYNTNSLIIDTGYLNIEEVLSVAKDYATGRLVIDKLLEELDTDYLRSFDLEQLIDTELGTNYLTALRLNVIDLSRYIDLPQLFCEHTRKTHKYTEALV